VDDDLELARAVVLDQIIKRNRAGQALGEGDLRPIEGRHAAAIGCAAARPIRRRALGAQPGPAAPPAAPRRRIGCETWTLGATFCSEEMDAAGPTFSTSSETTSSETSSSACCTSSSSSPIILLTLSFMLLTFPIIECHASCSPRGSPGRRRRAWRRPSAWAPAGRGCRPRPRARRPPAQSA